MPNPLLTILKTGLVTNRDLFPELPEQACGLPAIGPTPCEGNGCDRCSAACPTGAIRLDTDRGSIVLDRGRCIGCGACLDVCPSGTLVRDRSTRTAVQSREELLLTSPRRGEPKPVGRAMPFRRSLHVREVAAGDSACDLEAIASTNSLFDIARFGIHFVASPRHADALLVSGPVGRSMQESLRRCYEAMAEPRIVIALGTSAIGGGLFAGGYADTNGVDSVLPVDCYIPGDPPHPWSIVYGLLLAMGRVGDE